MRMSAVLALAGVVAIPAVAQAAPVTINACMITTKAKCPGAKLQGQDLSGVNMSRSNLKGANMRGANLRKAKFSGANLQGVDFTGADIRGADFSNANLDKARLVRVRAWTGRAPTALGANCNASQQNTGGSMVGARLNGTTMTGNYSYWNFNTATMQGVTASGVNFTCATFTYVKAQSRVVVESDPAVTCAATSQLYKTNLVKAVFSGADLTGTMFDGWYTWEPVTYPLCSGGTYTPPVHYYPDLTGVNFAKADLTNVSFEWTKLPNLSSNLIAGAVWRNTMCPMSQVTTGLPCNPTSPT